MVDELCWRKKCGLLLNISTHFICRTFLLQQKYTLENKTNGKKYHPSGLADAFEFIIILFLIFCRKDKKKKQQNNKQRNTMRGFNLATCMLAERL